MVGSVPKKNTLSVVGSLSTLFLASHTLKIACSFQTNMDSNGEAYVSRKLEELQLCLAGRCDDFCRSSFEEVGNI